MAKISQLPSKNIVDAFRGKLDFYTWCNLTIVRKWPHAPGRNRVAAVVATQAPFAYINKLAATLPANVVDTYKELSSNSGMLWKDYLTRLYINGSIDDTMSPRDEDYIFTGEQNMRIVILDPEVSKASHSGISDSVPWTDIDVSDQVPAAATHAIIRAKLQCNSGDIVGDYGITLREKGGGQSQDCVHWWAGMITAFCSINDTVVPLDANKELQYRVNIPDGGGSVYVTVWIVGYYYELG